MKKTTATTVLAGLLIVGATWAGEGHGHHAKKEEKAKIMLQTTCPVMGGKINKDLYADHDGERVYFCCPMCSKTFAKDPEKYIKKLEDQGVTVAKVQATCPVMGGKINKDPYIDHDGRRIYVCCPGCIGKIEAAPDKYIAKAEKDGVVFDRTPAPPRHAGDSHKGHNH